MKITTALICDAAEVREGLLFVLGGGITRLWRDSYPAPLGVVVALAVEMTPGEAIEPHEVGLEILNSDGQKIGDVTAGFQIALPAVSNEPGSRRAGEMLSIPLVLPLHGLAVPEPGGYEFRFAVEKDEATARLTLWAETGRPPGVTPPMP